jgi:multicomponent Na+:H+ antiporter subunit D
VAGAERVALLAPIIALALVTVLMGVGAEWVFSITDAAARQLLDPTEYVNAVLGVQP